MRYNCANVLKCYILIAQYAQIKLFTLKQYDFEIKV